MSHEAILPINQRLEGCNRNPQRYSQYTTFCVKIRLGRWVEHSKKAFATYRSIIKHLPNILDLQSASFDESIRLE